MKIIVILVLVILTEINCQRDGPDRDQLEEFVFWDIPKFEIPSDQLEQAISSGSYVPSANGINAIAAWRGRMYVTTFRAYKGVASGLSYFNLNTTEKSPVLIPYPSFDHNYVNEDPNNLTISLPSNCSVISGLKLEVDKCDRLWVIDTGETPTGNGMRRIAPPALIVIDMVAEVLLRRHNFDPKFLNPLVILNELRLDFDSDSCEDVHAYISDEFRAILVYSFKKDRSWRIEHNYMAFNPHAGNYFYENQNFHWNEGVASLAIGVKQPDGSKRVYFAPFTSTEIFYVSNQVLQDENYTIDQYYYDFHILAKNRKGHHTNMMVYDEKTGALFNTRFGTTTVGCWNTRLPYHSMNTVRETSNGSYPYDMDIDSNHNLSVLTILSLFTVFEKDFKPDVKNFRIFRQSVEQALVATKCKI